jgi:hypothetical protein
LCASVGIITPDMLDLLSVTPYDYHAAEVAWVPDDSAQPAGAPPRMLVAVAMIEVVSAPLASIDSKAILREQTQVAPIQ